MFLLHTPPLLRGQLLFTSWLSLIEYFPSMQTLQKPSSVAVPLTKAGHKASLHLIEQRKVLLPVRPGDPFTIYDSCDTPL